MGRRYDWAQIRADYVEGVPTADGKGTLWPTHKELAAKYGPRSEEVSRRSSREQWIDLRTAYQRRVEIERQSQRSSEIARIGAELDVQALNMARDGLVVTNARLQELGIQTQRRVQALQNEDPNPPPPVDALELERVSRAAQEWYLLGTRAIGQSPKLTIELEGELELSVEERDAEALGVLAILREHAPHIMPPEIEDVIDIEPGRLQVASGNGASGNAPAPDPTDE